MKSTKVAKVFTNGMSQAVRLPKEFRFNTSEVFVSKEGNNIILTPKPKITWQEFFKDTSKFKDFTLERKDNIKPQTRDLF